MKKYLLLFKRKMQSGPGCSKLTTSLVIVSLKFQMLISEICQHFLLNKSTASGAKYARSSVIFPHRNGLCQGEVDAVKTGPKLNLIKKI